MGYDIEVKEPGKEFKICPECGYQDGFHSMFSEKEGIRKWLLICPECHKVYDIGLKI